MNSQGEKKVVNEYRLYVNGLFGRNRKVKGEGFPICETPACETLTSEQLNEKVKEVLEKVKVKYGKITVSVQPVTITTYETYTERSFAIFGGTHLQQFKIGEN